ncbi:CD109 antigen-like [Haliotis rufescens]|uniref:CD109 antigen-like n=1 Tax=Haliotis rufescens TaxID=6454 RepID=UPI00201EA46B|nr:CD109 antigen-like [Haliotis rufescens]XP_048243629.1 CD109 antigen-like [Haliotis rufescens]
MLVTAVVALLLVVTVHAENSYLITATKRITLGRPFVVNVNILNASSLVDVDISIVHAWYNNTDYVKTPITTVTRRFKQDAPDTVTLVAPQATVIGSYLLKVKGSGGLIFEREERLTIARKTISVFIQTDKAMYKPGQRVHFRAFAVYPDMKVYQGKIDVDIYDPRNNRIRRWVSLQDGTGVNHRDILLSDQPVLGDWKIEVTVPEFVGLNEKKTFTVQQYELPKFEVKVELPPFSLTTDIDLSGTVKANYTYGKGVKGMVELRVFVGAIRNSCGNFARSVLKTFPIDGSARFSVSMGEIKKLQSYLNQQTVTVLAEVKEDLTGKTLNGSSNVVYYTDPYKITFLNSSPSNFKPGLPYRAYVKVTQQDDRPISDANSTIQVYTCVDYRRTEAYQNRYECNAFTGSYSLPILNLRIPENGIIPLDLDIPDNTTDVKMRAYYKNIHASKHLSESHSQSDTFVQVRLRTANLKAGDNAEFEIQATSPPGKVAYQIMSRGVVVKGGIVRPISTEDKSLILNVPVLATMSPTAHILVNFVTPDGEIVADSISFNVDGVFANKVGIAYSTKKAEPHTDVTVDITADPQSSAFLLAVDQSVQLLKTGNDISTDQVMKELREYDYTAPRVDFLRWSFPVPTSGTSATEIFQRAGVIVITDAQLHYFGRDSRREYNFRTSGRSGSGRAKRPRVSSKSRERGYAAPTSPVLKKVERVREIFPETWLWLNTTVGPDGRTSIQTTVPDTITSWVASAFAISPRSGLGVAPTSAKLQVFRSFFVSLNLPLSVVRGEQVVLQANVFNYLPSVEEVTVELKKNSGFQSVVIGSGGEENLTSEPQLQTYMVGPGEAKAVYFPIVPSIIGDVEIEVSARSPAAADAVKRQLRVKAEGIRKEKNIPVLVDLTSDKTFSKTIKVSSPPGLVEGSERVRLTVTGDLLGPSLDGMENLLSLPTGCGEQNMLKFAPNIYIANYLEATNQMTRALEDKIKSYLEVGYQRQLSYQRSDGSFSTFGERDEAGSVWLTSFVVKSLFQARQYIYVDNSTIDKALSFLADMQTSDGAFVEPGRVIDKQLQGTKGSGPGLTAYVLIALVETSGHNGSRVNSSRLQDIQQKAMTYLERQDFQHLAQYPLAITTYALSKAGSRYSGRAFLQLKKVAKNKDGKKYWDVNTDANEKKAEVKTEPIDILTTAYGLMTFVSHNKFSPGMGIMRWLSAQRNPRGGFISSQDTTVALEALTLFMVGAQPDNYNVRLQLTAGDEVRTITVNNKNALVLQSIDLTSIPPELKVSAEGTGFAVVELGLFYNVESVADDSDVFDVSTVLLDDTINGFTLMTCAKHLQDGSSGMCVETIQIPSGFTADLSSAGNIAGLKRLEQTDGQVVAYFDSVGKTSTCMKLSCSRVNMVAKNKPVYISMVDYYKPDDSTVVSYHPRRLQKSSVCEICPQCSDCN